MELEEKEEEDEIEPPKKWTTTSRREQVAETPKATVPESQFNSGSVSSEEEEESDPDEPPTKQRRKNLDQVCPPLSDLSRGTNPKGVEELPELLKPDFHEIRLLGEFFLVAVWPLHSFSSFSFLPLNESDYETNELLVKITRNPPPASILVLANPALGFLEGHADPQPVLATYCLTLPKKVSLLKPRREKHMMSDLLSLASSDLDLLALLPENEAILGIEILWFEIAKPRISPF